VRWLLEATLCAVWIGAGLALFFFVDLLLAWQIKLLQSKPYRIYTRVMGLAFVALGLCLAWVLATHKLS
jgi:hypothetical protein